MLKLSGTSRQRAATLLMAVLALVVFSQAVVLAQNLGEAPDFVEGVIKRCRRDPKNNRLAEIAF